MAVVSAAPLLLSAVSAYFTANPIAFSSGTPVPVEVTFGAKALTRQPIGFARIVFAPGDDGGAAGDLKPPRINAGRGNPRPIVTCNWLLSCALWCVDKDAAEDELAQFVANETFLEASLCAIRSFAHADGVLSSLRWRKPTGERPYGRLLTFPVTLRAALFAPAQDTRTPTPAVPEKEFI